MPGEAARSELEALGAQLFEKHACASCHNPETSVGKMALQNAGQRLQYAQLIERLATPTPPMPVFPLNEREKRALAVYLLAGE